MLISKKKAIKGLYLLSPILSLLSWFIPKNNNKWAFVIDRDHGFEGNLRAFFDHVYNNKELSTAIIDVNNKAPKWINERYPNTQIIPNTSISLKHIFRRLSFRVYIITHGPSQLKSPYGKIKDTLTVNLWHGIPIKGMGNLDIASTQKNRKQLLELQESLDLFVASSETEKAQIAGCFLLNGDKIKVTGMPRNDWLLAPDSNLPKDIGMQAKQLRDTLKGRRLVLYGPTWRDYDRSLIGFNQENLEELTALLERHQAVLGIRPHPKDSDLFKEIISQTDSVIDLSSEVIPETSIVLHQTDVLITDYSSMWVDYLLLDKPIIAYLFDFQTYNNTRGLMYDFDAIFPGPNCKDFNALKQALSHALEDEHSNPKQQWVKNLLHKEQSSKSCENICREIEQQLSSGP